MDTTVPSRYRCSVDPSLAGNPIIRYRMERDDLNRTMFIATRTKHPKQNKVGNVFTDGYCIELPDGCRWLGGKIQVDVAAPTPL